MADLDRGPEPTGVSSEPGRVRPWVTARLAIGTVVAGLLSLLVVLVVVPGGAPPTVLDEWVVDLTAEWTPQAPWAVDAAAAIGVLTDVEASTVVGVLTAGVLLARRMWVFAAFVTACGLAGVVMVELLKRSVGRLRPPGADEFIESGLDRSFPSGHASVGVYLYGAVSLLVLVVAARQGRRLGMWLGVALFTFGIVIGLSRIVIGVHWTTDVLAGWALSSVIVLLATVLLAPQNQGLRSSPATPPAPPASR